MHDIYDKYEFSFLGIIRVSSIAEHDEVFLGHQDCDSARKTTICYLCYANRKNNMTRHKTHFDHCKLTNVKLYLNSEFYPYINLNLEL